MCPPRLALSVQDFPLLSSQGWHFIRRFPSLECAWVCAELATVSWTLLTPFAIVLGPFLLLLGVVVSTGNYIAVLLFQKSGCKVTGGSSSSCPTIDGTADRGPNPIQFNCSHSSGLHPALCGEGVATEAFSRNGNICFLTLRQHCSSPGDGKLDNTPRCLTSPS